MKILNSLCVNVVGSFLLLQAGALAPLLGPQPPQAVLRGEGGADRALPTPQQAAGTFLAKEARVLRAGKGGSQPLSGTPGAQPPPPVGVHLRLPRRQAHAGAGLSRSPAAPSCGQDGRQFLRRGCSEQAAVLPQPPAGASAGGTELAGRAVAVAGGDQPEGWQTPGPYPCPPVPPTRASIPSPSRGPGG